MTTGNSEERNFQATWRGRSWALWESILESSPNSELRADIKPLLLAASESYVAAKIALRYGAKTHKILRFNLTLQPRQDFADFVHGPAMGYCRNASSRARKTCSRPTLSAVLSEHAANHISGLVGLRSKIMCIPSNPRLLQILGFVVSFESMTPSGSSGMFIRMFSESSLKQPNGPPLKLFQREGGDKLVDKNPAPTPSTNLPWKIHCAKSSILQTFIHCVEPEHDSFSTWMVTRDVEIPRWHPIFCPKNATSFSVL